MGISYKQSFSVFDRLKTMCSSDKRTCSVIIKVDRTSVHVR